MRNRISPILLCFVLFVLFQFGFAQAGDQADTDSSKDGPQFIEWSSSKDECAICDKIIVDGFEFYIFEHKSFILSIGIAKTEDFWVVGLGLENMMKGRDRIEFNPNQINLSFKKKKNSALETVHPLDPTIVAKKIRKKGRWANFFTALGGAYARQTATVRDQAGNTATITVPDNEARRASSERVRDNRARQRSISEEYLASALRANTIVPGDTIRGNLYFKKEKVYGLLVGVEVLGDFYIVGPFKGSRWGK